MLPDKCLHILNDKYIQPTYRYDTGSASSGTEYMYPPDAIRELIVNAIVHKDYSLHQNVSIHVYADKLMIHSPGFLPEGITLENLKGMHASIKRNTKLAEAFYAMKYIEGWGQGIKRVLISCKENGNPEPEFSYLSNGLLVTLRPKENTDSKSNCDKFALDAVDQLILNIISINPKASLPEISLQSKLSMGVIRYHIDKLRKREIISREGSRKSGIWVIKI